MQSTSRFQTRVFDYADRVGDNCLAIGDPYILTLMADTVTGSLEAFYLAEAQRLAHTGSWAFNGAGFKHWSPELFAILQFECC